VALARAPAPAVVVAAAVPAPAPAPQPAKPVPAAPAARGYQVAALGATTATCADSAPVLERVLLRSGGTALVCTLGNGTLNDWQPPSFGAGALVGVALGYTAATAQNMRGARIAGPAVAGPAATAANAALVPKPPKGWKLAWTDGRLNPMRGVGTPEGQAMQDQVWTCTVPARLVTPSVPPMVAAAAMTAPVTRVSTMSAPAPKAAPPAATAASHPLYIQIGSFAVAANAAGATARITALGLPAATSPMSRGGTLMQIVFVGPFAGADQAQAALLALKAAGFRDAFLR
jgi:cell division septation protein DedD